MKKQLLLFLGILTFSISSAQTFTYEGINYSVTGVNQVTVASNTTASGPLNLNNAVTDGTNVYSVVSISDYAFSGSGITSVTIPNTINSVGNFAFENCTSLTSFNSGIRASSIGNSAFSGCSSLNSITFSTRVETIGSGAFENCTSLTSITIPPMITSIKNNTFYGCSALNSIVFDESVTSIENNAFAGCSALTSITLPKWLKTVGTGAFESTGLTSVVLPDGLTSIGFGAFGGCRDLASVTIPFSVTSIGNYAFNFCTNLNSISCSIVTPLVINANVFSFVNQAACKLIVPTNSVNLYKAANVWKDFSPITDNSNLKVDDFSLQNKIQLYPNPAKNEVFLQLQSLKNAQLQVVNVNGGVVISQQLNNTTNTINTTNLPNGIYLFRVSTDEGITTTKILKN